MTKWKLRVQHNNTLAHTIVDCGSDIELVKFDSGVLSITGDKVDLSWENVTSFQLEEIEVKA